MDYSYKEIQGKVVEVDNMKTRAKSIALATLDNPSHILNPKFFVRNDNAEIICLTLDIQIPQHTKNDIRENEDVAIICYPDDEYFPEVYALRGDFPLGLPHTNAKINEYPVSLCVTEENFQEVKHRFIAFEFIEKIRSWLSLTSRNKLHAENQALEPFFIPKGFVVLPELSKIDTDNFHIEQYAPDSILYKMQSKDNGGGKYFCFPINADEQISGYIQRTPQKIKDLESIVTIAKNNVSAYLSQKFNHLSNFLLSSGNDRLQKKVAFCCFIPVKRNATTPKPERTDTLLFFTKKTIQEIGIENNIWDETPDKSSVIPLIGKSFRQEHFEQIDIELYSWIPNFSRSTAATYNSVKENSDRFVLIGAGALGSQVLSLFARTGFGKWTIIDYDTLFPHNLARHALNRSAIGYSKVVKLAEQLNELLEEDFCKPINDNFCKIYKEDEIISKLKNADAIIDISTSIAVARLLARDYDNQISTRRISAFLNPAGQDLVILAEDAKRKNRLDFLEMEYYRFLYQNENLHNHLNFDDDLKIRYNRNSCREITNRINQTDVSLLSSICAKVIRKTTENQNTVISIWRTNPDDFTVQKYSINPTKWNKVYSNEWKIYLNLQLLEEMRNLRTQKLPNETGGVLLGSVDTERKIIYIYDTLSAPEDSKETAATFERGIDGVLSEYEKYRKITDNQIQYLGEWHSHPKGCSTNPSSLDIKLLSYLSSKLSIQGYPTLMIIVGDKDYRLISV
jgi:integrative and conjugative element protein (TIGR02256 family)